MGIHIQLNPAIALFPIIPSLIIVRVMAPPPNNESSTMTMANAIASAVLVAVFIRFISLHRLV